MATRLMDEKQVAAHNAKVRNARGTAAVDQELRSLGVPVPKRRKYGNQPVVEAGVRHASRKEQKRYRELGLLLKAGEIHFLARQVRFILPGGIEYVADFAHGKIKPSEFGRVEVERFTVEDVKAPPTADNRAYRIKAKLMLSEHGITIEEV